MPGSHRFLFFFIPVNVRVHAMSGTLVTLLISKCGQHWLTLRALFRTLHRD